MPNTCMKFGAAGKTMRLVSDKAKLGIKLGFSLAFFAGLFFFSGANLAKSWQSVQQTNKVCLLLALLCTLSFRLVLARRWQILAEVVGFHESYKRMLQLSFIGLFFNFFLPSTVGGDVSKTYYLCCGNAEQGSPRYLQALSTVFVDRLVGVATVLLFGIIGIVISPPAAALPLRIRLSIFAMAGAIFFVIPFLPQLSRRLLGESNWLTTKFNTGTISFYWKAKNKIMEAFHLSNLVQILCIMSHVFIGMSLGLRFDLVPISFYFILYSSVAILAFVTPSINGIGVREWAYTRFLTAINVDCNVALTYSLLCLSLSVFCTLVGAAVYITTAFGQQARTDGQQA